MITLVELNSAQHKDLKVNEQAPIQFAQTKHLLPIKVAEVGQALCNFPLFMGKDPATGYWNISAVTSFTLAENLWVEDNQWQAVYQPACMQTYPFYLMNSANQEKQYTIGIDEKSSAFSQGVGQQLFEDNGQASLFLSRVKQQLEASIQNDIQTFQFGQFLQELDLLKSINVIVEYENQPQQTLTGLYTINEDKLHSLADSQLGDLNRRGYLTPINGILLSISQLNGLIQKNNKRHASTQILSVKLELTKN